MSILVALFTWIYIRDRQHRVGLWMLGWIAVSIHFAADVLFTFSLLSSKWTNFIKISTLEVAGVCFILSVSEVYVTTRRRILYFLLVGLPSVTYLAFALSAQESLVLPVARAARGGGNFRSVQISQSADHRAGVLPHHILWRHWIAVLAALSSSHPRGDCHLRIFSVVVAGVSR